MRAVEKGERENGRPVTFHDLFVFQGTSAETISLHQCSGSLLEALNILLSLGTFIIIFVALSHASFLFQNQFSSHAYSVLTQLDTGNEKDNRAKNL